MNFKFVVVRPFGGFEPGTVIGDAQVMLTIEHGEHADHVVRTLLTASTDFFSTAVKEG